MYMELLIYQKYLARYFHELINASIKTYTNSPDRVILRQEL